ncbi:MAG: FtsQ-type POTRA domain-containing protein [Acidimicrobiales bacterium]
METSTGDLPHRAAHIDPRIRARRIDVQRGLGRQRLQRLVDLALLLAVAAGFAGALRSPLLDVDAVRLEGNERTPDELVLERAGIAEGDQLVDVDLRSAGERLADLPWVAAVRLHRGLDGQVAVRLTERTPVAVAGDGEAAVLVDAEGRVLARGTEDPALAATLVRLAQLPGRPEPGQFLPATAAAGLELATRLGAAAPGLVIDLADEQSLVGTLGTTDVRFGPATQLDAKVRSLRTVLDQVDLTCAARIDVRAPGSPVLTREEGCS